MLTVRRSEWHEDDLSLLCGIANAGGGDLLVSPNTSSHAKRMKHFRKSFESIPRLSRQELGLSCTAEPIMDGVELCLEIKVPPATSPLQYQGTYYFYTDNINTIVTKDILDRLFQTWRETGSASETTNAEKEISVSPNSQQDATTLAAKDQASLPAQNTNAHRTTQTQDSISNNNDNQKVTFKDRSIAAANRLDLTSTDEFILKVLETDGRITAVRIADILGVSESTVRRSFRRLRETGFIERIGSNKAGYWRLRD